MEASILTELQHHTPALFWSLLYCIGVIIAGFDPQLIGSLLAVPAFQRDFGTLHEGVYLIPKEWQTAFNIAVPLGQIIGAIVVQKPMERFGRKLAFAGCVIATTIGIVIQVTALSKAQIFVAEIVNGIVRGAYPVLAATCIAEITPLNLRSITGTFINISFVVGQLVATGVLAAFQSRNDRWAYVLPFCAQFMFPLIIATFLYSSPESPYFLVRRGRVAEARKAMRKLTTVNVEMHFSNIRNSIKNDLVNHEHDSTLWECFQGCDRRRTWLTTVVMAAQPLTGSFLLISYATYFFELAGMSTSVAFRLSLGQQAAGVIATVVSWGLISTLRRRTIFNSGMLICTLLLAIVDIMDVIPGYSSNSEVAWIQCGAIVVYNLVYQMSIGPICFVIQTQLPSSRLRGSTIAIANAANALINLVCAIGVPYGMNPDAGYLRGKLAFVFLGSSFFVTVCSYFCLPETKGRSPEQLDELFDMKLSARDFKNYDFSEKESDNVNSVVPDTGTPPVDSGLQFRLTSSQSSLKEMEAKKRPDEVKLRRECVQHHP